MLVDCEGRKRGNMHAPIDSGEIRLWFDLKPEISRRSDIFIRCLRFRRLGFILDFVIKIAAGMASSRSNDVEKVNQPHTSSQRSHSVHYSGGRGRGSPRHSSIDVDQCLAARHCCQFLRSRVSTVKIAKCKETLFREMSLPVTPDPRINSSFQNPRHQVTKQLIRFIGHVIVASSKIQA
jgi:hypothetical protein